MIYKKKLDTFNIITYLILTIWMLVIAYPFYCAVITSLTPYTEYLKGDFILIPKEITFDAYKYIFKTDAIITGLKNSLIILILGTAYNMFLTTTCAYALSRKWFPGKNFVLILIIITMYFGGGLIPLFILVRSLGMANSLAATIIPLGMNTFYMIILKTLFESVPESLTESARIDGANDFAILVKIMIPVSLPAMATVTLFYAVDRWNEWYYAMIFLKYDNLLPLQMILKRIMVNFNDLFLTADAAAMLKENSIFNESISMATMMCVILPVLFFYPFAQKYFLKGIMIGAIKS